MKYIKVYHKLIINIYIYILFFSSLVYHYVSLCIIMYLLQMKTANLLGIVGTDVPIEEIQKLVSPYKVDKIGYANM